ncbi:ABC transporter substrate-binding protein [Ketogulonicigenium vulgare]|uniref:ABC transporter, substrate-binding protein n=1 Tax=Ketogulonicigenium vulgare (strain WSH-001) TaxID=759362 RepID=F9Y5M5_KETVW|nr:ABC transporter substrate-binding protein [Ketogulonicigenium vulgare]ADO42584.1 putative solute-binding component of ABC transporter [Ketogulonicigenium vulgare Y25]AEM40778.1 ABC transporter, substrate-binding protein [Ketogulonicigenium vulgare WSH-001]ALJ80945.1 ABC transporter substrate-binding protein [Ketogulonicigenium vulgare]ANW33714.1 ABC transporter substrate-binding protein [Ketogulonicigenium vulgare]AOZ54496.1 solute-binding component of ABC transporter [Ketogulonicigenium vu
MPFALRHLAKSVSVAALCAAAPFAALAAGEVTFIQPVEPTGLDPTQDSPVAAGQVTWQNVFEGLVTIDRNAEIQPQLAESWEISEDGLTYTFHLRDGVTYHNGAAFDANVAKFSFDKLLGPDSTNGQKALYAAVTSVDVVDDSTLTMTLSAPNSDLLYWLGFPAAVIVEPTSAATNATAPVGTGPFKVDEWRMGDRVIMSAFDGYWGGRPALDTVTARFIADPQAQVAALRSGQANVIAELGAPELFAQFTSDANFTAHAGAGEMEVVAGMNNARPPFDDARVRQALMMSIDRSALVEVVTSGLGTPIGAHFSPASPFYEDLTGVYTYDPEGAKALLAEAGYGDGFTFTFTVPNRTYAQRSAEIMQAFFQQVGVTANIEIADFPSAWVTQVMTGRDFDMTIIGHAEPLDINIYARHPYYFNYEDANFDATIAAISAATTPEARAEGYQAAQEIIASTVPALFLYSNPKLGVWSAGLEGVWENGPVPSNDMTDVRWAE